MYFDICYREQKLKLVIIETGHSFQRNDYLRSGALDVSSTVISEPTTVSKGKQVGPHVTISLTVFWAEF